MALATLSQKNERVGYFTPFVCKQCGEVLSLERAFEFHHPLAGRNYRLLDGIYCADCYSELDIPLNMKFSSNQDDCDSICSYLYHLSKFCQALSNCMGMPC